ncbi:lysozyme C-1-like [Hyla sarda]|uniref:lysozyme C-1-like n=1 Tax=Hyla sarda TaxID=327740 RepID=UPI0024C3FB14|nr:lysozyme C-1-like [Hyla sarda]
MKILIVLVLSAIVTSSWASNQCRILQAVRSSGIAGYKEYSEEDYVCLAWYASNYDTKFNRSPTEYGAFQINSKYWCDDGKTPGRKNLCGMPCRDLLDENLADDLKCVTRIVQDPKGLDAWEPWTENCKGQNISRFTEGC